MAAFTRKRQVQASEVAVFGWCSPGFLGNEAKHAETDAEGNRVPGTCPGEYTAAQATKNYPAGTLVRCECSCHGEGRVRYDGYVRPDAVAEEAPDEDDDLEMGNPSEAESETVQDTPEAPAEPPLPVLTNDAEGGEDPAVVDDGAPAEESPSALKPRRTAADGLAPREGEHEAKRFNYPNGYVVKMESPGTTKDGREVTVTQWVPFWTDGTRGPAHWSRKAAKEELD